jgi:hypothetical protein
MATINFARIKALQKQYGVTVTQEGINSGHCWQMEGNVGRFAMDCLRSGICMLSSKGHWGYYGNYVPSRQQEIKAGGTVGTFKSAQKFWQKVEDGAIDSIEYLEATFVAPVKNISWLLSGALFF